ncbi:hypothetical protein AAGS39_21530 [Flavobacterium sp. CGRL2]
MIKFTLAEAAKILKESPLIQFQKKVVNDPKKKKDLEEASIIAIYSFDKDILSVNNSNSKISANKKTVFLKQSMYSVLKKSTLMNNTIQLKP